jgi:hypothetical protein
MGALLAVLPILSEESVRAALDQKVRDPEARSRNGAAFDRGRSAVGGLAAAVQR